MELRTRSSRRGGARGRPPPRKYTQGVFAKYAKLVTSASKGAVCVVRLGSLDAHPPTLCCW